MNKTLRNILLSFVVMALSVGIGYGMPWLIQQIRSSTEQSEPSSAIVTLNEVEAPEKILESIKPETLALSEGVEIKEGYIGNKYVSYTAKAKDYRLQVPTLHSVQLVQLETNKQDIHGKLASFLSEKKLTKASESNTSDTRTSSFDSKNVICDVVTYQLPDTNYHLVNCEMKFRAETAAIETNKLLDLTGQRQTITKNQPFFVTSRTNEDNKSLSILRYTADNKPFAIYFAAIDNKWEYLGKQQLSTGEDAPPKPEELAKKISERQADYGDFLTRHIGLE